MAVDIRTLDPNDPGYDAAVEAALRQEDEADGLVEPEVAAPAAEASEPDASEEPAAGQAPADQAQTGAQTDAEPAAEGKGSPEPTPAAPQATGPKPAAGVLGKDGKTVLPYTVLKSAREEARVAREAKKAAEAERDALREQLEAVKKGGKSADGERAEDELLDDETREQFPALAKMEAAIRTMRAKVEPAPETKAAAKAPQDDEDAAVQDAIDSVPALAEWQASDPSKFARAVKHDEVLRESPKWANRPLHERFAAVAKIVADEYGVPMDDEPQPASSATKPPATPRQDPKVAVQQARRAAPNTLSDFKGGAAASADRISDRTPAPIAVARYMDLSDDEIDRQLARLG